MRNLKINVQRGVNLAVRDLKSSDPYVVLQSGNQKVKTRVIKENVNPVWNETLTISAYDSDVPIKLSVYDKDRFSRDDKIGEADIEVGPFLKALKMHLEGLPDDITLAKLQPSSQNCLTEESCVVWLGGRVSQKMILRLRNVECGEVEIQLLSV